MTFDDAHGKADQEFELTRDPRGDIEYSPKYVNIVIITSIHSLN